MVQCNKSGEEYCRQNCFHAKPHEINVRCKGELCEGTELIVEKSGAKRTKANSYYAQCVEA